MNSPLSRLVSQRRRDIHNVVTTIDKLRQIIDNPEPRRANYQYGGFAGIDSLNNPITLTQEVRQHLLEIVKAVQGSLYPEDTEQTDRALLKGVWSALNPFHWEYGFEAKPYPPHTSNERTRQYDEESSRLEVALKNGGLVALLEAQIVFWDTLHTKSALLWLEDRIDKFIPYWNRLAAQIDVTDPNHQDHAQKFEELRARSKNYNQYPSLSPHGWDRG